MKTPTKAVIALMTIGVSAWVMAQDFGGPPPNGDQPAPRQWAGPQDPGPNGPPGRGPRGQRPPVPPLMRVLDANHDGVIDATEIANAAEALKKLDKNGDGKLTRDELRPRRPEGRGRFGGPGRPGGPRGSRGPQARGQFGPPGAGPDAPRGPENQPPADN